MRSRSAGGASGERAATAVPDEADVASLAREAAARKQQLVREVDAARRAADEAERAVQADPAGAPGHRRRAEGERQAMHKMLQELASLDKELADLDAATRAARAAGVKPGPGSPSGPAGAGPAPRPASNGAPPPRPRPAEDPLARLKAQAAAANRTSSANVEDELAALKRKMTESSKKK